MCLPVRQISLGPYTLDFVRAMTPHEEQEALKDIGVDPHPPDELPEGPYARPREHSANSMKHSWGEGMQCAEGERSGAGWCVSVCVCVCVCVCCRGGSE